MSNVDTREASRASFFLMADVRAAHDDTSYRLRVRNLSPGGMMADGDAPLPRGSQVNVALRNIGEVEGAVVWKQDDRCGIAFAREIDPALARAPLANTDMDTNTVVRPPLPTVKGKARTGLRNI
jgi:hypothetical protein